MSLSKNLTAEHLDMPSYFKNMSVPKTIAIAVSGGADSMAMASLIKQWAVFAGVHIVALIVNHNIRNESADEAQSVADALSQMEIKNHILTNTQYIDKANLQANARKVRYELLEKWCVKNSVIDLCVGHHLDDCLETVLIRKNMGSGLYGLAAMSSQRMRPFGRIIRPCLELRKNELIKYCDDNNIFYVNDPSNHNVDFERVKNRQALLNSTSLVDEIMALRKEAIAFRKVIDNAVLDALTQHSKASDMGFVSLNASFTELDRQVQFYTIRHILLWVSGAMYGPRTEKLEYAVGEILKNGAFTLNGCRGKFLQGKYYIFREIEKVPDSTSSDTVYDNRFYTDCKDKNATLGVLGKSATGIIKSVGVDVSNLGIPKTILPTIPAVYIQGKLCKMGSINFKNQHKCDIFNQNKYLTIYSPF